MRAYINHKVNTTILTFTINIVLTEQDERTEYLEFNKEAGFVKACKDREILLATADSVFLYTPYEYKFNHVKFREHPALNYVELKTNIYYLRLKELSNWLMTSKVFLRFNMITAWDYFDVIIDSEEHTITIQTLENDEVLYDYR